MIATTVHEKLGLKEVINASGKMTILGVSKVSDSVFEAQKAAGSTFFEMDDLFVKTGDYVAELVDAPSGHIVSCASAGIGLCVNAVITKGKALEVFRPYDFSLNSKREIVMPMGHLIDYGTPIDIMIAQGGGRVVLAGQANVCQKRHVEMMINEETAALFYVKSHHTVQKNMLTVADMAAVAKAYDLPLIVDAAAEEDVHAYLKAGAQLVIYSGAKAFEGPSSGLVIGETYMVEWVRASAKGIGRSMKIGKENVLGLVAAVEAYMKNDKETGTSMKERLAPFITAVNGIEGLQGAVVHDGAGRDIFRASVKVLAADAYGVIAALKEKSPAIYTREYQANQGIIEFDIRSVDGVEMDKIVERLAEIMKELR